MICARLLVIALALAVAGPVAAQPAAPCDVCVRGDAVIDRFSLQPVRPLAGELAELQLADPLTPEQYTRILELRARTPALVRLGAVDDADLALVAAALCRSTTDACVTPTTRALRCLAERCAVTLPRADPRVADLVTESCNRYVTQKRSSVFGVGIDWATGWHRSRYPHDGRAWSFGIATRLRITNKIGAVARFDRVAGRDAAEDVDGNGRDDMSTGSITRLFALGGPSFILDFTRFENTARYLRLDVLGGYVATRSQPDEDGPAAGFDLAYHLWTIRTGVRYVQGFGDAREASTVLAHLGFVAGASPEYSRGANCSGEAQEADRSSRLAIGLDLPVGGYGLTSQLGYLAIGLGFEAKWYLSRSFDVVTRADMLVFPRYDQDRVIHQAVLGGLRIDHGKDTERSSRSGWFTTVLAGYSHGAGIRPTTAGTGPIADVSLAWGGQGKEGAGWLRLHARFGLTPENIDYRVLLFSLGFELRFDPRRWRSRV
ncbi:MAG TPA: hypothetical protein VIV11_14040 [Kofleriaceae bacterium]